jgi:hypothetical protein
MPHWLDKVIVLLQANTADLRELARIAGGDPKTFYRGIHLDELDTAGQDLTGMEFNQSIEENSTSLKPRTLNIVDVQSNVVSATEAIRQIRQTSRQEERMALLVRLILINPYDGARLLSLYSNDKAKYANSALMQLEIEIRKVELTKTLIETRRQLVPESLVRIVDRPFSRGMPVNRTLLLYYMAKHLAVYPDVNKFLQTRLDRSSSIFLVPLRKEIQEFLNYGKKNKALEDLYFRY